MPSLLHQIDLWRGLMTGERAIAGPIFVDVSLTSRCNLQCIGCAFHSPYNRDERRALPENSFLPIEMFASLCNDLRSLKTQTLILQGEGEPLLHPHVVEIVSLAKREGFEVMMITNGTRLNERLVKDLTAARLDTLKVSLWGTSREQYQANYPGTSADQFDAVVENLRMCRRVKTEADSIYPRVVLTHPINRNNYTTLERAVHLAAEAGSDAINVSPMTSLHGELAPLALNPGEVQRVCAELGRLEPQAAGVGLTNNFSQARWRYRMGGPVWERLPCYAGWFHARVQCNGLTFPCGRCDWPFGDLRSQSFREIWNAPATRAFRRQTLTHDGMAGLGGRCDCAYCCYITESARVHKVFRFFAPFVTRRRTTISPHGV